MKRLFDAYSKAHDELQTLKGLFKVFLQDLKIIEISFYYPVPEDYWMKACNQALPAKQSCAIQTAEAPPGLFLRLTQ